MKRFTLLWYVLFFLYSSCSFGQDIQSQAKNFIKSFVEHYDFSPEGRYTHEYHPFLLEKTKTSLKDFEQYLQQSGLACKGRIVIMGYQQEGVASYYSSLNALSLHDEASLTSARGRVVSAHNIFGFLTGFLLKDANWLQRNWFPGQEPLVEHIAPERVDLFDDYAYIFQKHAFGKDFDLILDNRKLVEKSLKKRDLISVLKELTHFWERAYKGELKSCSQEVLATQDILFSIDYAKHLCHSTIPVSKMYIGPDITYPIEILSFQEQAVTETAQFFVKKFTETLQPVDDKKTAYIFCSFVDGVGKSTLLGNVINCSTYGDNIEQYQRVDNASSQKGVLYHLKKDVWIMDLPAQLSHWVSKPDGYVFVDASCVQGVNDALLKEIDLYITTHQQELRKNFEERQLAYKKNGSKPVSALEVYVENSVTVSGGQAWIPFEYGEHLGIFDSEDISAVRLLTPLEGVHSKGLKTAQPEQMLFTKGLMVPMRFQAFMDDVMRQFKDAQIEQVLFVDFLSMYPRSSRETVRVNFLLQHLKKVYRSDFSIEKSLYRSFVNREVELYHMLALYKDDFVHSLFLESVARASLYTLFLERSVDEVISIGQEEVGSYIQQKKFELLGDDAYFVPDLVEKKIVSEQRALNRYAFDRRYELFVRFSWEPLYAFSRFMENLFLCHFSHPYFSAVWAGMEGEIATDSLFASNAGFQSKAAFKAAVLCNEQGSSGQQLTTGASVRCIDSLSEECRDAVSLSALYPVIRAHWYVALANLLYSQETQPGLFECEEPAFAVPPLVIKKGPKKTVAVIQKQLPLYEEKVSAQSKQALELFNNYAGFQDAVWTECNGIVHCTEWSHTQTSDGIYGFGYDWRSSSYIRKIVREVLNIRIKKGYEDPVFFASELANALDITATWKNGSTSVQGALARSSSKKENKSKKIAVDSARGRAIALWVRATATLEMLVKDPYAQVVARRGVQLDFIATLRLLERVTLPRYFGIEFDKPLFADYSVVEPVIPWHQISC